MTDKRRKIIEKINNLTVDFAFFLRNDICKTAAMKEIEEFVDRITNLDSLSEGKDQ